MTPEERHGFQRIVDLMMRPATRKLAGKALKRASSRDVMIRALLANPDWFDDWPATRQQIGRMTIIASGKPDIVGASAGCVGAENRMDMTALLAHVAEPPSAKNVIDGMMRAPQRRPR